MRKGNQSGADKCGNISTLDDTGKARDKAGAAVGDGAKQTWRGEVLGVDRSTVAKWFDATNVKGNDSCIPDGLAGS